MNALHRHRYALVLAAAIAVFAWLGLTRYLGAGRDDVFITLYAGQALANGQGIVNYNGERVEMSSSLFHTLLVAAIDLAAPNYVFTLNKLLGGVSAALTLVVLYCGRAVLFRCGNGRFIAYTATLLIVATNPAYLYWAYGGLETPFAALFLTAYAAALLHHRFRPTAMNEIVLIGSLCLYMLTRPEGFYLLLFTAIYLTFIKYLGRRPPRWRVLMVPCAFFACVTLFRLIYFGYPMPNPVYAKSAGLNDAVANGWVYFKHFYSAGAFLWLALAVQCVLLFVNAGRMAVAARAYPKRVPFSLANVLLFGLVVAAQLVVLAAGGDWMEHFRFLSPIIPLLTVLTMKSIADGIRLLGAVSGMRQLAVAVLAVAALVAVAVNPRQSGVNTPRPLPRPNDSAVREYKLTDVLTAGTGIDRAMMEINADHYRDIRLLFPFFDNVLPGLYERTGRIVVATGQMGFFPYWMKRKYPNYDIEFVDTLGLCDATVSHMPLNKDHTGVADGRYVDEVLDGQVPLLPEYVKSKAPNFVYFLGFDPATDRRLQTYARHGFLPVQKKRGAVILYKDPEDS